MTEGKRQETVTSAGEMGGRGRETLWPGHWAGQGHRSDVCGRHMGLSEEGV